LSLAPFPAFFRYLARLSPPLCLFNIEHLLIFAYFLAQTVDFRTISMYNVFHQKEETTHARRRPTGKIH
ncbi:MAG: hypothetical protein SOW23_06095, partial [Eubacteriales bacterium]|nr:hypothetical protein [Eubacteriales bacterium]